MSLFSINVYGLERALRTFTIFEAKAKGANKIIGEAVAHPVLEKALELVPVDTGRLYDSLQIKDADDGGLLVGSVGVPYAGFVEYGTPARPSYPAQPYLRPAADVGFVPGVKAAGLALLKIFA